jgi:hypothetical protein
MSTLLLLGSAWLALIIIGWSWFAAAARADRWGSQMPPAAPPGIDRPR